MNLSILEQDHGIASTEGGEHDANFCNSLLDQHSDHRIEFAVYVSDVAGELLIRDMD